jgi:multiple sugar transport system substrate-binding protein
MTGGAAAALGSTQLAAAAPVAPSKARWRARPAQTEMRLSFPSWQQDEPGSSDWWNARIAAFQESHPGVVIEFTKVPVGEVADRLTTQFAGGQPPQIIHLPYLNLIPFADQGLLEPLDDYFAQTDIPEVWTPLQAGCEWGGSTYALLLLAYGYSMIYNEQLLADAGVDLPTDPEAFVAAAKALTEPPAQFGFGTATLPGFNLFTHVSVFIIGNGGHVATEEGPSINTPEAAAGVSQWVDLVRSGSTPTGMETGPMRQLVAQGNMAMWFDGPWGQGFVREAPPEVHPNIKATQLPFANIFGGSSNVITMPASISDEEKQVVWEFIESLSTPEAQHEYVTMYCTPSARQDVEVPAEELHEACPLIDSWIEALNSPNLVDYYPRSMATKTNDLVQIVSESMQRLITSDAEIQPELDQLQEQLEALAAEE